jgi:hypothetical protein
MPDVVSTKTLVSNGKRLVVLLQNRSDSTGESDIVKVDKSTLTNLQGVEPSSLTLVHAEWTTDADMSVNLRWDHTSDVQMLQIGNGFGCMSFEQEGGLHDGGTGGTGDIILSTAGATATSFYTIKLDFRLE